MNTDAILITTEYRGVFFGHLREWNEDKRIAVLDGARNVVYWENKLKGFLGLASEGPTKGCRIGPKVDGLELHKVTSRVPIQTKKAIKRFEAAPWA